MNNEDLKPCPFCGGEACTLIDEEGYTPQYSVQCQSCKIETLAFDERAEAIAAWNRRNCSEFPSSSVCVKQNAEMLDTNSVASNQLNTKPTYADIEKMVMPLEWKYERRIFNGVVHDALYSMDYMFTARKYDNQSYWTGCLWNNCQFGVAKTVEEIKAEAQKSLVDLVAAALGVERSGE